MKIKIAYALLCFCMIMLKTLALSAGEKTEAAPATGVPTITTAPAKDLRNTSVTLGCQLTDNGGSAVTAFGLVMSLHPNPDLNAQISTGSNPNSIFYFFDLKQNTTYYVRAFATNSSGTAYGNEVSFTTLNITLTLAAVTTNVATNIDITSVTLGGNATDDGGSDIYEKGVVWGPHHDPVMQDDQAKSSVSRGLGAWSSDIQGLFPGTTYYVRSYAGNKTGLAYGNEISFRTSAPPPSWVPAEVTTNLATIATNNGETTVNLSGNVRNDGNSPVTSRGFAIGLHHNPSMTARGGGIVCGSGTGAFIDRMGGFIPNTTYYVRAYATNSLCTAYGNEISFRTPFFGSVVMISDNISTPTTWSKGNVYILDRTICIDATLTIEPGTVVKFKPGTGIHTRNAGIEAIGTPYDVIIFTAYSDDLYLGDNNGDGAASVPTKGYWGGIRLQARAPSNFTFCSILYAGSDNPDAAGTDQALRINTASEGSTFRNCTIAHTRGGSDYTRGAVMFEEVYNCVFTDNVLYDNGAPIVADWCGSANFLAASNIFWGGVGEKNALQGIFLNRTNHGFTKNTKLSITSIPYVINGINGAGIDRGIKVTLADGVIVKFLPGAELDLYSKNNSGIVNGQGPGVVFTTFADDAGGDSNGDGNLTAPANGDWKGIYDKDIATWLTQPNIKYGSH